MKKILLGCIASLLITGVAQAAVPCNGFEITIKNNLQKRLFSTTVKLNGANITPRLVEINSNAEKTFTIASSDVANPMSGELIFRTISLPSKKIHVKFDLTNELLVCKHVNQEMSNPYSVAHTQLPTKVVYTIG